MPTKQSRKQSNPRKTRTKGRDTLAPAGPVWPSGRQTTELKSFITQSGNYQMYHNVAVTMTNTLNLFDSIVQGTNYGQRIGNRIHLHRLRARIVFNNKFDRPNVSYRVAVTAAPTNINTDSFAELFGSYGAFTGIHSTQNSQLLHDAVFPFSQGSTQEVIATSKERSHNHTLDLSINRPVVYSLSDGKATTTLTVWFISYDSYGTLSTDNISSVAQVTWELDYTDS